MKKQIKKRAKKITPKVAVPLRIDLGCGPHPKDGFIGVDMFPMENVSIVCNLAKDKWPWKDNTVDEAHAAHFIEHITNLNDKWERTHFFNELYRVLKVGGKATLIFPHWCSERYYGDPTHKEPFSEMGFYYLSRLWRMGGKDANGNECVGQAPHSDAKWQKGGYNCDFEATWGYSMRNDLLTRNQEFQQQALQTQKGAALDIIATLTKI